MATVFAMAAVSDGLGHTDIAFSPPGTSNASMTYRARFGLEELCVGRQLDFLDGSIDTSPACMTYGAATLEKVASRLPVGASIVTAAAQEVSMVDLGVAVAGASLVGMSILGCLTTTGGAVLAFRKSEIAVQRILLVSAVLAYVVAAVGSICLAAQLSAVSERSRLVSNVTASWAAAIKSVEGLNSTSVSLTSTIEPEAWLGIWQALPLFFAFVFCVPLTIIAMLVGPSAARTEDSAGNIGCCGDEFISPESFNRSCDVVSRAKRRTTDDQIDPWVADWWRLMALPPLSIVHIASFVVSAIAATGPVFTYKAQGQIIDTANSNVRVDFAEMLYEMSMTTGCLFTNSTKLPRFGYASGMCFDAASPHRLQLSAYRPGDSPTGQDFSVVVMADVASTITKMQGLAVTHAVTSAILVALLLGLAMCNMRQGAAARAFKRWGKLVGVALFVCGILGIVDAATIHDARSSLSRRNEYLKTFSDDGSVSDESLFQQLAAVTNPLVGRLQFVAHSADLVAAGSEGDDLITAVTVLAVFSGLLVLPLAGIICLGTLNGAGVVAGSPLGGAAAQQGTVSRAAASASGNAAKGAHTAAFMKSSAVPSPSAADVARFGCLAGIQDHSARLADQSEAERLAEHVQQVRASGLDENIVAALFEAKPEGVARRARELVGSGGATARAGAFKTAPDSVAVAVAPPPDDAAAAVAVVAPPDDGAASAEAPSSPPTQQPALPLPPMAPNGLGVTSTFEL